MENRTIPWNKFIGGIAGLKDNKYEKTNIECPECNELLYKDISVVLTTYPCKYNYKCFNCGWTGVK